nr:MAG TPA: hypothetical protein [Caudoviricetes sp.]
MNDFVLVEILSALKDIAKSLQKIAGESEEDVNEWY